MSKVRAMGVHHSRFCNTSTYNYIYICVFVCVRLSVHFRLLKGGWSGGLCMSRTHFGPTYVFASTDESVRGMQELLLPEQAAAAYAVSSLCARYKWCLKFVGTCKGLHITSKK